MNRQVGVLCWLLSVSWAGWADDLLLQQAQAALQQGHAQAAFAQLLPLESQRAGEEAYDEWLGTAALQSGHLGEAALALERCLITNPRNGPCRLQMMRVHMALSEWQSAKQAWNTLEQSQPPSSVQALLQSYLSELAPQQRRWEAGGYLSLLGGYDSNANMATDQTRITVPLFDDALLPLSSAGVRQHSGFAESDAGWHGAYKISPVWTVFSSLDLGDRAYVDHASLDDRYEGMQAGMSMDWGVTRYSLSLQQQDMDLGSQLFRRQWGAVLSDQWQLTDRQQLALEVRDQRLRYPQDLLFNADRRSLDLSYAVQGRGAWQPQGVMVLESGKEVTTQDENAFNGFYFVGVRTGWAWAWSERWSSDMSLALERRQYEGMQPVFMTVRNDTQYDATLGVTYRWGYGLYSPLQYAVTRAASNTVIDRYARRWVSWGLRYEY